MRLSTKPECASQRPTRPFKLLKPAVVIIDMHEPDHMGSSYPFAAHVAVARRICHLLQATRNMDIPVLLVAYDALVTGV